MTRRVTGWLVSDYGGEWDDSWTQPVRVFTNRYEANRCADVRHERLSSGDDFWDYCGSYVTRIEVVIND